MKALHTTFMSLSIMAAAALLFSCSSDDSTAEKTSAKTFHYTVGVSQPDTRATLTSEEDWQMLFEAGDQLVIYKNNTELGTLTLTSGAGTDYAIFDGTLTGEEPAADDELTAKLVSTSQEDGYGTAETLSEAVQKYSVLTATSTYADRRFDLAQGTTFVKYNITLSGTYSGSKTFVEAYEGGTSFSKGQFVVDGIVINANYAANACRALGNDWYFPTAGEMFRALDNLALLGGYHTTEGQESYPLLMEITMSGFGYPLGDGTTESKAYYTAVKAAIEAAGGTMIGNIDLNVEINQYRVVCATLSASNGVYVFNNPKDVAYPVRPFLVI